MHLLETYALSTGSKIGHPFIVKKFFPVQYEKYITIQNSSGMPSKCYDYFQQVVDHLSPILNKYNIGIIQIGGKEDSALQHVENLQGVTNINQTAHVLSNSMLHVGNDSFAVHMANSFGVKTVGLYSITLPEIAGPYYNKHLSICLYPDNEKPSFNPNENPKRINKITPEQVIASCLSLLGLDNEETKLKTLYIGNRFTETIIETIPNQIVPPTLFSGAVLNIRCDYVENIDINILYNNIANRSCCIVTDKPFDTSFIPMVHKNISLVIYDITKDLNIEFIKNLEILGVKYACCFNSDFGTENTLSSRKEQLIDHCGIEVFNLIPKDFDANILNNKDIKYKSNRVILSAGKAFYSYAAYIENIDSDINSLSFNSLGNILNKKKFLEDLDYCLLYTD